LAPACLEKYDNSFFAIGTGLQALYVAPYRMTDRMWDILAEGARWSRDNARPLVDTHWIGGDPNQLQIYGCASWQENRALVMLRNPADHDQAITLKLAEALELPSYARSTYTFKSPWQADAQAAEVTLDAADLHTFKLAAFEVRVLESIRSR